MAKLNLYVHLFFVIFLFSSCSKYYIYFRGSLNGTSYTEIKSSVLTAVEQAALTTGFNHVAVTWNLGSVKYYFNGVSKGTGSIGTVRTAN